MRLLTALVVAASLATAPTADACKCAKAGPVAKEVKKQATAFTGTILSSTEDANGAWHTEIEVDAVYRGTAPKVVTLDTGDAGGDCSAGELGKVGERWLVVSTSTQAPYEIFICSVTQKLTPKVAKELKKLGKPRRPT